MTRALRLLAVVLIGCCAFSITALVWSYWTANGVGSASGAVAMLTAPTNVTASATPGDNTVTVSWGGVVAPDGGEIDGYYVQRYTGTTPSAACFTTPLALISPSTTCDDVNVPDGTFTYVVTAVFHSWTAPSTPSAPVTVAELDHFSLSAPASATAGTPFTVTATAKTSANSTITGYLGTVHFTSSDPNAPVLPSNYAFVPADNGAHTFTNGVTLKTVPSQTVTVNDTADPTSTGTASVNVTVGTAAKVAVTQPSSGGTSAVAWSTQPKVTVQDASGNTITTSSASVTLAITPATGTAGAVLTCTANPKAAAAGIATFAGCKIDKAGTGYTLTATATGLTGATSAAFDITAGAATKVVYTQQPTAEIAGAAITPAVVVTVQDSAGNTVTTSSATVAIAFGANPGAGTLSGTASLPATNGVATFADLSINKTGTSYTLVASSTGLTSATSSVFNITVGAAAMVAVTQQTTGGTGGVAWTTQPKVTIQDTLGNTVTTSTASVTLAITPATGTAGAVLTCTANPKAAAAGIAVFAGCKIDKAGTGYTLTATATGLTGATTTAFDVVVGPPTKVVYTQQPTSETAGAVITPEVVVTVQDAGANTVTTSSATVAIAFGANPGAGTLSGTVSLAATNGVATFSDLSINKTGTSYTLVASSTGLTSATSSVFNVTVGAAAKVAVTQQTTGGTGGVAWTTQPKVTIQDALGNTVTTSTANVTLAITPGTGTAGAVLTCTANPKAAVAGIATFAGCKIDKAGTGYTLTASSTGLTSTTSTAFDIATGPATKVVYTQPPTAVVAGSAITPSVVVTVQDVAGNTVTTSSATVAIAIGTNPGAGTLSGTVSLAATNGVATFSNLSINKVGTGYTLVTSSTGLTSATSGVFNVTVGAAAKVAFTQQPNGGAAGAVWTTQPKVTIQDASGNTITTSTANVTLAITPATGTAGAVLTCTANPKAAAAGIATFAGCKIDRAGTAYTLTATATGLAGATSTTFNVT